MRGLKQIHVEDLNTHLNIIVNLQIVITGVPKNKLL